jgi:hypothetical protein
MVIDHFHEPGWVRNPEEDDSSARAGLAHHEAIKTIA